MKRFNADIKAEIWEVMLRLPAEEAVGVEGGAGCGKDVQEGMDGGGRVTQVQNYIYKILE